MNKFLIIFLILTLLSYVRSINVPNCGTAPRARGLVVAGKNFESGSFPWMAALFYENKIEEVDATYFCGGSLISTKLIVTGKFLIIPHLVTNTFFY